MPKFKVWFNFSFLITQNYQQSQKQDQNSTRTKPSKEIETGYGKTVWN